MFRLHQRIPLIAVWNSYKTRPLVNDKAGQPYGKGGQNQDDDDQMDGVRKQAASLAQGVDERPTCGDPCHYGERQEDEGDEYDSYPDDIIVHPVCKRQAIYFLASWKRHNEINAGYLQNKKQDQSRYQDYLIHNQRLLNESCNDYRE